MSQSDTHMWETELMLLLEGIKQRVDYIQYRNTIGWSNT